MKIRSFIKGALGFALLGFSPNAFARKSALSELKALPSNSTAATVIKYLKGALKADPERADSILKIALSKISGENKFFYLKKFTTVALQYAKKIKNPTLSAEVIRKIKACFKKENAKLLSSPYPYSYSYPY